ncbi:redoxin domain-containing protein [Flavobacterium sp. TP390]|uniref:thioredoxin-dependent peroxiredoxin n=1 Tax=Flavobacterium profundi TaxID=1774945 RepID=A0A6I4IRQ8_9FLAO|nr:peroxiredoxin [Flavobacterium profundi]MVO07657.1 redoxin domain-containing protein [Flavobacterium profundi]
MSLKVGDKVPNFSAKDQHGANFIWDEHLGKPIVLYFYPKDDTPGCTAQACSFRDEYEDFKELGAEVIGVSGDSEKAHTKFAQKYKLPFILLSDQDKSLRKLFGVPTNLLGLLPGRVTYIINAEGTLVYIYNNMSAKNHVSIAKDKVKEIFKDFKNK